MTTQKKRPSQNKLANKSINELHMSIITDFGKAAKNPKHSTQITKRNRNQSKKKEHKSYFSLFSTAYHSPCLTYIGCIRFDTPGIYRLTLTRPASFLMARPCLAECSICVFSPSHPQEKEQFFVLCKYRWLQYYFLLCLILVLYFI